MVNMMEELISALENQHLNDVADMVRRGECSIGPFHCLYHVARNRCDFTIK